MNQYAMMLTASLTEPGAVSLDELVERIDHQVAENESAARDWMKAVRRVQAAGLLTAEQADGFVLELAYQWHGDFPGKIELLRSVGAESLAEGTRTRKAAFWLEVRRPFLTLKSALDKTERASRARYPSWDDPDDDATMVPRTAGPKLYDEQFEAEVDELAERWRMAVNCEPPWTVADALAFDYLLAHENIDGAGDVRVAAIQRAHADGALDRDLAWYLLDRMAEAMASAELSADKVLTDLTERKEEAEDEGGGPTDRKTPGSHEGASAAWLALDLAEDRRAAVFKGRVLRAVGEDEMVREMKERPEAFRELMRAMRKKWDTD